MNERSVSTGRVPLSVTHATIHRSRLRRLGAGALSISLSLAGLTGLGLLSAPAAFADPAIGPGTLAVSTPGALSGTVPDGTCRAGIVGLGGGGASSGVSATTGGYGGAGARISATVAVLPGQAVTGNVAGGGINNAGGAAGGVGGGGAGGTIPPTGGHRGGGGGGRTAVVIGGKDVLVAGGGGGGGAAHQASPQGNGGAAGTSVTAGGVAAGADAPNGYDVSGATNTGGRGGTSAAGGAGGTNSGNATFNGSPGTGVGTGTGGNGGPDNSFDSSGGGGAGYTGGGGGASTVSDNSSGSGGGGGSSWVVGTSPTPTASVPTGVSGAAGPAPSSVTASGANGSVTIDYLPCQYDLAVNKSVSPNPVAVGNKATWTVTVTNNGPDPMTKGDTIDLTDTLPAGPNGPASPAYKVISISVSGGSNADMATGQFTCSGVTVGSSMPGATNCSRPYNAPAAPGAPSGGVRGLNVGETLTITYEQDISPTATCPSTITNVATIKDRPTTTGTTDVVGVITTDTASRPLTIGCPPKLRLVKALSGARLSASDQFTMSISPSGAVPSGAAATTSGAGSIVTANTGVTEVASGVPGTAYTFGEAMAAGSGSALSQYSGSVSCVNSLAGSTTPLPAAGSTGVPFTITPTANDNIVCTLTNVPLPSSLTIAKSTTTASYNTVGQKIPYSFAVKNTGQTTLTDVTVSDPQVTGLSCASTSLAPGASTTCTGTHTVTQADIDAGKIVNTATVTGTPPGGSPIPPASSLPVTTPASPLSALSIVKSTTKKSFSTVGETVPYSFAVTNTGNVTLNNIIVSDAQVAGVVCSPTSLAPGATASCTGNHTVTQADLDAGKIDNTATVTGTPPGGSPITPVPSKTVTTPAVQTPSVSIAKSTVTTSVNAVGQSIPYTFTVKNTGNVTLTSVTVSDPAVSGVTCLATTLAAGASTTCSGTHTVTQADLNSGSVVNTASVVATPPSGTPLAPTASNTVTVPAIQSSALKIEKATKVTSYTALGAKVPYTFTVTNSGNVTVGALSVTDPLVSEIVCALTKLAPGESTTCTGDHIVTQGDIDKGAIVNTASATATAPSGKAVPPATSNVVTVPAGAIPAMTVSKKAGLDSVSQVGEKVPYTFVVSNTGNVTLTAIALTDPLVDGLSCPGAALKPGTSMTCTGTHIVTQADLDAGAVVNTASATATPPSGDPITPTSNTSTVPAEQKAVLEIGKAASAANFAAAGEQITYTFTVKNPGNVTIDKVDVVDPLISNIECKQTTLAPGEGTECTGVYTTTEADVVAGKVINTARAIGVDPNGKGITPAESNTVEVPIDPRPSMTIVKSTTATKYDTLGALVPYTFVVTNTGNVALTSVVVNDPKTSGVTCAATSLPIGANTTCTGTHLVTQVDLDAKNITNTATVSATPPSGAPMAPTSSNTITIPSDQKPSLTIAKATAKTNYSTLGESVPYTFTVKNTGNVTVSAITVTDPKVSGITCTSSTLTPGASTTCTGTHTVTQADLDAGKIVNTATVDGTPPSGVALTPASSNTVTVPATQNTGLNISKSTTKVSVSVVGDVIPYTFTVTNTGNVTLTAVTVADPNATGMTCGTTTLAPNQSTTCTASHTVTQADLNAGSVLNSATVTGTPPSGTPLPPKSSNVVTVPATQNPVLSIAKASTTTSFSNVGATVPYTFVVKNDGNVTMNDIAVSDPNATGISCPVSSLAPGASVTCTGTHVVTQDDLNSGAIINTASVVGTPPNGTPSLPVSSNTVKIPATQSPSLSIAKATTKLAFSSVGETFPYTFTVTNTGNVTLSALSIADPNATGISCPMSSLQPGEITVCTGLHTVTQADLDAGSVINTASAVATPPSGTPLAPVPSNTVTVPATQSSGITIVKSSTKTNYATVGEAVPYEFVVTNNGNVTLTAVSVNDPNVSGITCDASSLAPTAQTTCTGTHTVTQADLDAGTIVNTASVVATPPNGTPLAPTPSNTVTVTATQSPALSIVKATTKPNVSAVGESIPYTFTVKNTGNVTMTSIAVSDPNATSITCPVTTLAPGESTTCTGTHIVTQADLNVGEVINTASVTGNDPTGASLPPVASNTITVPAIQSPSLSVVKATTSPSYSVAGEAVPYTFTVTNTGNVSLTALAVSDPKVVPISCPTTNLAPGETTTCTGTRIATQADVDAGAIINTASALATPPSGASMTPTSSNTITIAAIQNGTLSIVKSSPTPNFSAVGQLVSYSFVVTNTGNVTVTALSVSDPNASGVTCPTASLAPNESTTCTATHTVTQADLDAGKIVNTASAVATPPNGTPLAPTSSNTVTVPAISTPSIEVVKATSIPSYAIPGFTIPYTFVVKNTGNVTLTSVAVNDPIVGAITCDSATLAPGASTTCSGSYVTTQADVDAGAIINKASASAVDPQGSAVAKDSNIITVPAVQTPNLAIVKATTKTSFAAVGEQIAYTFTVTNNGNVTMTGVAVTDPIAGAVTCSPTTLAPGEVANCTATRAATQADLDAGTVVNTASVIGTPPNGTPIAPVNSNIITVPAVQSPGLTIAKSSTDPSFSTVGATLTYSFIVTNSGNVTISDINVTDPKTGPVTCPVSTLVPSASTTCTATHTVIQADLDAGSVVNTASVSGITPQGAATVPANSNPVTIPAVQSPVLTIVKSASAATYTTAGEVVTYNFTITNAGNVTITSVMVNDPKVAGLTCSPTTLAPGEVANCSGTHTVSQAEVDAGQIDNTATVTGTPPNGTPIPEVSSNPVTITAVQSPSVTISKVADKSTVSAINEKVTYTFTVKNTGNVTLDTITVNDPMVSGPVNCAASVLAPGASTTCTGIHLVTPAELDAGLVSNVASVTGTPPSGSPLAAVPSNKVDIPAVQSPALTIAKRGTLGKFDTLGQLVPYMFDVENTGNVTISGVTVNDPGTTGVTCTPDTLAAGERTTCVGQHVVVQADLDAGSYVNTASVTGTPAGGTLTPANSNTVTIPAIQNPLLTIAKSTTSTDYSTVGQIVRYSFDVVNTGTVTLTNVIVVDATTTNMSCPGSTLAPGGQMTCTAEHAVTQADLDAGQLVNQAKVVGTPPNPASTVSAPSNVVTIPAVTNPSLNQVKAADPSAAPSKAGDPVSYTISVTNSGNVTMSLLQVNDPQIPALSCPTSVLAPGETTTCSGTHTTTQAEVDAGKIVNTAYVDAKPPHGSPLTPAATNTIVVPITPVPAIAVSKSTSTTTYSAVNVAVPYTFVIENTGNTTLFDVTLSDAQLSGISCQATTLAPGATTTCSGTHTTTQADIDTGVIVNTASASGVDPNGTKAAGTSNQVTIPATQSPSLIIEKTTATPNVAAVDTIIPYSFTVKNNGNVTLTSIVVDDPNATAETCPTTPLAPGASFTCTAEHKVTQADLDLGVISNTASVVGTPPTGAMVPTSSNTVDVLALASPKLNITKAAVETTFNKPGDIVHYNFVLQNTGNVTLSSISVNDPLLSGVNCDATVLAPTQTTNCRGQRAVTQDDIDRGSVVNVASATGNTPANVTIPPVPSNEVVVPGTQAPALTITKKALVTSVDSIADEIQYEFVVTNTGNNTIRGITVNDPIVSGITCARTTLAPSESTTCTGSHQVTQTDLNAGKVTNIASVSGKRPNGTSLPNIPSNEVVVPANPLPKLVIVKSTTVGSYSTLGENVPYKFTVTNVGNVTMSNIAVTDAQVAGVTCLVTTLNPTESTTCSGVHTVTQTDIDAGAIINTASVSAQTPNNTPFDPVVSNTLTIPVTVKSDLVITKSSSTTSYKSVGDIVEYTFQVTNNGNQTLTNIAVADGNTTPVVCQQTTLAAKAATTCTAKHVVTQDDLNAGSINNIASVTARTPNGKATTPSTSNRVVVPAAPTPSFTAVKAVVAPATPKKAGDVINYTITVTNTGNVTLSNVSVDDPQLPNLACPVSTLAPSVATTCTGSHAVTQSEVNAGVVNNTASVVASPPQGAPLSPLNTNTVAVPIAPAAAFTLKKATPVVNFTAPGQNLPYTFTVRNTGNVTLTNIVLTDPMLTDISCPALTLAPNASLTCTGTHITTQADLDTGSVVNTASVAAKTPAGTSIETPSNTVTIPAVSNAALSIVKATTTKSIAKVGEKIPYTFTVTSSGSLTLTSVKVDDPKITSVVCPTSTLAPKATMTCTATYIATQADVDAGSIVNVATVGGVKPDGKGLGPIGSNAVIVPVDQQPTIGIVKSTDAKEFKNVGDAVPYTFVVTNSGNVTLSGIEVTDPITDPVKCPKAILAPGESMTCTAVHRVIPSDAWQRTITNTASVAASLPSGARIPDTKSNTVVVPMAVTPTTVATTTSAVTNPGTPSVPVVVVPVVPVPVAPAPVVVVTSEPQSAVTPTTAAPTTTTTVIPTTVIPTTVAPVIAQPSIKLTKSVAGTFSRVGDTLTFTFVLTNDGNTTLEKVQIDDPMKGLSAIDCGSFNGTLAVGESTTCSATYKVTLDDLARGEVINTARAEGYSNGQKGPVRAVLGAATARLSVSAPSTLPFTGANSKTLAMAAGALVAAGGLLLLASRRRRKI